MGAPYKRMLSQALSCRSRRAACSPLLATRGADVEVLYRRRGSRLSFLIQQEVGLQRDFAFRIYFGFVLDRLVLGLWDAVQFGDTVHSRPET